jgi:hypothetical protein
LASKLISFSSEDNRFLVNKVVSVIHFDGLLLPHTHQLVKGFTFNPPEVMDQDQTEID